MGMGVGSGLAGVRSSLCTTLALCFEQARWADDLTIDR